MSNGKVALIILDGYGIGEPNDGNAIYTAKTPVMDGLLQRWPHTKLSASGLDVGLPDGQMGNSEVGHTNIGSGRVVFQDLPRITKAIEDGTFFENPVYGAALDNAANGKALHILGLLSDGGVHSHIRHILAMVKMAHDRGIARVYLHCFLDGRDVAPTSGAGYVRQLRDYCASSAPARSRRCRAASTAWTATSAGTASRPATTPWSAARVYRIPTPSTRWRPATLPV